MTGTNKTTHKPALLALADGSLFYGVSVGVDGQSVGEVVFNTAMTGYQEILTDPSYAKQIVTLTYPHIGNVGVNAEDEESSHVWAAGLVVRDLSRLVSNWRAERSLSDYLQIHRVVGIADIDTRRLTRILRDKGAQSGCVMAGDIDEKAALAAARSFSGLEGMDLAKVVSTSDIYEESATDSPVRSSGTSSGPTHIVVYDFGVKRSILHRLRARGCRLTVVPAQTPVDDVLALKPDGIFLSNGPGDPAACDYAVKAIQRLLETKLPIFGICLGHQLLALACGAKSVKMKFGHHGANHPVQDLATQRVFVSSQNHCFAIDEASLPKTLRVTHRSLFDDTVQGIEHTERSAFGFQGHPEASPGPHDLDELFDRFVGMMRS